ncbi:hypothetical protein BDD43_3506 [Mucilaginibacter gracilis]|uniref:Uncharacterized protein n=1 Tax=Mucilaginibacter gracilis TaxID=423350 RepID=A0A495J3P9_9SPHI|nr:hypothetical protein [Mucilaginibacter gracilis]RKR83301.1 hypothetical protein BDD43_3506 [Mucilaginibacter gracilis]
MIKIKLNNKPYNFPTNLNEIRLGQWLQLRTANGGQIGDIAILTGLDASHIAGFKTDDDFKRCLALLQVLRNNFESDLKKAKIPDTIQLGDKTITIPKKLELEPIGAYVGVYNVIASEYNTFEANGNNFSDDKMIADILAYYLWKPYNNESAVYSDEAVDDPEYRKLILNIGYLDAATIAMFFFRKFPNL